MKAWLLMVLVRTIGRWTKNLSGVGASGRVRLDGAAQGLDERCMVRVPERRQTSLMSGSPGHVAAAPLVSLLACLGAMAAPAAAEAVNHPPAGTIVMAP